MWGQWGVVSTKGATAYFPVPLIGLRSAWGSPADRRERALPTCGTWFGPGVEVSAGTLCVVCEPLSPRGHRPPRIFFTRQACDPVRFYQMIRS